MPEKSFLNFFNESYEQRYKPEAIEAVEAVGKSELIRGISPDMLAVVLVRPGVDFEESKGILFIAYIHHRTQTNEGDTTPGLQRKYLFSESPEGREDVAEVVCEVPVTLRELGPGERDDIYDLITNSVFL